MSDEQAIPPTVVIRCACKHREPLNLTCQYAPPHSCGGVDKCPICRGEVPAETEDTPATTEPTSDTPDVAIEPIDLQWSIDIPPTMMP